MKTNRLVLAALAAAAIGCSGAASTPAISGPTAGDPNVGTVTFRVSFPSVAVDPSLISTAANTITVKWEPTSGTTTVQNSGTRDLTRTAPSTSVKLPIGNYYFTATAKDSVNAVLEAVGTGGKVIGGENAVVLTFLNGKWLFKDGVGNPLPIELLAQKYDASGPLVIDGFYLYGNNPNTLVKAGIDASLSKMLNVYRGTWITNDVLNPNKEADIQVATQFGGGAANPSGLEGLGYDLTANCGELYNGNSTCNTGPDGGLNHRNIRIMSQVGGGGGNPSDQAMRRLLPETWSDPTIFTIADSRIVDGATLSGHLLEYVFTATTTAFLKNQPPPAGVASAASEVVAAAQSGNVALLGIVGTSGQQVISCQDGYNGFAPDGVVSTGTWDFRDTCCTGGPCVPCGPSTAVYDGQGKFLYATRGNFTWGFPSSKGECNWGLVAANPSNLGEWCDNWDWTNNVCLGGTGNGVVEPWEFHDLNGDGYVDTGSFYFAHYLRQSYTLNAWAYPFTAKGSLVPQTLAIQIQ